MSNIISLEAYRDDHPHIVLQYGGDTHVFPLKLFENILDDKLEITDVEGYQELFKCILSEWLNNNNITNRE